MTTETTSPALPKVGATVQLTGTVTEVREYEGDVFVVVDLGAGERSVQLAREVTYPGNPARYLSAADIARHCGVTVATIHTWRSPSRYGPDRAAEQIAKAPTCPQPDVQVGESKPTAGWLPSRLGEWDEWRKSLPGQGNRG